MIDFFKSRATKAPVPPGTLEYVGPERDFTPRMELISYNTQEVREQSLDLSQGRPDLPDGFVHLVNVIGVHDKELIHGLGDWFGIHPLTLEDVMNTDIRPKSEEIDGFVFLVFNAIHTRSDGEGFYDEQLSLLWKDNVVILLQENPEDTIAGVIERIRKGKGRIRSHGPDYLVAVLLDLAVDSYFPAVADLGERMEGIEAEIIENPDKEAVARIYRVKREVLTLKNSLTPMREILSNLIKDEIGSVDTLIEPFLRDVQDHVLQAADIVNSLTYLLSGLMELHVSLSSLRMNEVMKVLTVIATIFIPLTFIAGVYGMNFQYMPELTWHYGYFLIILIMAAVAWIMLRYFKNKHWF